jgi:hypothetical protein
MRQPGPGVGIEHDAAWNNESLRADPQPERMSDTAP